MKCSRCGYRAKDIGALGKHYRKAHPGVMKKKKVTAKKGKSGPIQVVHSMSVANKKRAFNYLKGYFGRH